MCSYLGGVTRRALTHEPSQSQRAVYTSTSRRVPLLGLLKSRIPALDLTGVVWGSLAAGGWALRGFKPEFDAKDTDLRRGWLSNPEILPLAAPAASGEQKRQLFLLLQRGEPRATRRHVIGDGAARRGGGRAETHHHPRRRS